jgi:hypothetical protein
MSITWHSFLYIPIWLYLENGEESEVIEEKAQPPLESQAKTWLYFDNCESEPDSPTKRRQAPVHATPFLVFLNTFRTLKSSEMCIKFIGVT